MAPTIYDDDGGGGDNYESNLMTSLPVNASQRSAQLSCPSLRPSLPPYRTYRITCANACALIPCIVQSGWLVIRVSGRKCSAAVIHNCRRVSHSG